MIVIVGESGSGKSTLQKMLVERYPDRFKKLVTYTTRPMRQGEKDGEDYCFITDEKFLEMERNNEFVEYNSYRGWLYGTTLESLYDRYLTTIAVLTPAGLRDMERYGLNVVSIYLEVDRESRLKKLIDRGDNVDEAYRRNLSDVGQFDGVTREVDYVISNHNFHLSKEQVLSRALEILGEAL